MARIGIYLPDDLAKRFKDHVYKKTGSFKGQSEIARQAIEEYLEKHENKAQSTHEDPIKAPVVA